MVRDIAEGYVLVTERTFRMLSRADLDQLSHELERHLRELRGDQPKLDDVVALQLRNRKIQRVTSAATMLRGFRTRLKI
jgi:ferritin-like metal-binding protein YciE